MARFRLTPAAKASLKSIGRYTENMWGKAQRNKYLGALDGRFRNLASKPDKGKRRDELQKDLRSCHEGKHVIFYFVAGKKEIIIVDILHQRMEPSLHLGAQD